MKVLMCNSFHYVRGGADRYFLDLSALLESYGHQVIPFAMADDRNEPSAYADYFTSHIDFPTEMSKPGVGPKLRAAERVIYSREAKAKIAQLISATQPDIAHIHGIAHETSPSILPTLKAAGIPVVQTLHDYKLVCPNTTFVTQGAICERCRGGRYYNAVRYRCKRDSLAASLLAGVEMYVHKASQIYERNIDAFVAPSRFLMEKVREHGIRNRIEHIPYSIRIHDFQPHYEPENYFIYSGRLANVKGIHTLLEAMRHVPHSKLYIAGRGELEASLKEFAHAHHIHNVEFLGYLETNELIDLLRRALFMVTPSEWYENYPMTVLESFACGTPVIGANIGGIPEQVRDGESGFLFESGNPQQLAEKMQILLSDRQLAIQMGRRARQQVERINDPAVDYQKTLALYESLLAPTKVLA